LDLAGAFFVTGREAFEMDDEVARCAGEDYLLGRGAAVAACAFPSVSSTELLLMCVASQASLQRSSTGAGNFDRNVVPTFMRGARLAAAETSEPGCVAADEEVRDYRAVFFTVATPLDVRGKK
jgi:hypothetical protein